MLHENVARHIVANRLSARVDSSCRIPSSNVQNIVVWGLPQTPLIDTQHAHVIDYGGLVGDDLKTPVTATLRDCNVQEELTKRLAEYHKRPQLVSAAAHAIAVHVRTLQRGTAEGQCISMAVAVAESGYNLPPGVVAGLPVVVTGGAWSVVKGLVVTEAVLQELAVRVAQGQFPVLPPAPAAAPPPVVHGPSDAPATPVPRADPPNLAAAPTPPPVVLGPSDAPPEPPADSVVEIKSEGAVLAEAAGEAACEGEGAGAGSGAAATEVKTD